jgi:hypothetical protein
LVALFIFLHWLLTLIFVLLHHRLLLMVRAIASVEQISHFFLLALNSLVIALRVFTLLTVLISLFIALDQHLLLASLFVSLICLSAALQVLLLNKLL